MKRQILISLSIAALGMPALASADVEALMQQCNDCHGDNGVSQWTDMPTIAGLAEFVHADALYIYMDGARPCADSEYRQGDTSRPVTNMCDIAANLTEDQVDERGSLQDGFAFLTRDAAAHTDDQLRSLLF